MANAVLLVDDERFARTVYSDYLRAAGFDVEVAADAEAALAILRARRFDVLVADVILPGSSGLDLLGAAKELDPNLEVVMITALDKVDPAVRAMKSGASDYLIKPVTPEALQHAVHRSLASRALLAENKALRAHLKLFEVCQRISATLDRDRLVPMGLAAVASTCGAKAVLLAELAPDGSWVLSGAHGLEYQAASDLLGEARDRLPTSPGGPSRPPSSWAATTARCRRPSASRWSTRSARSARRWPSLDDQPGAGDAGERRLPGQPPGPGAAQPRPAQAGGAPRLPRRPDPPLQHPLPRRGAGPRAGRAAAPSRCSSSTSITSRASTTSTATSPAPGCWWRWRGCCAPASATRTCWSATAATSTSRC